MVIREFRLVVSARVRIIRTIDPTRLVYLRKYVYTVVIKNNYYCTGRNLLTVACRDWKCNR